MAPQSPFFFSPNAQNRVAGPLIEGIRFQFHAHASPNFKCVAQHQVLGLRIHGCPLPRRRDPRRPNLDTPIRTIDVHKSRAPDHPTGVALHRRESYRLSPSLLSECLINELVKILESTHRIRDPAEDVIQIILCDLPEPLRVLAPNRFKPHDCSFQSCGSFNLQRSKRRVHVSFPSMLRPLAVFPMDLISCILCPIQASLAPSAWSVLVKSCGSIPAALKI